MIDSKRQDMIGSKERFRFLTDVGELLASSFDEETGFQHLARLIVPRFADWCAVDHFDETGVLQRRVLVPAQPELAEMAGELQAHYQAALAHVLRTGEPVFWPEVATEHGKQLGEDQQSKLTGEPYIESLIVAPLIAHERSLGAISLAMAASGRRYTSDDLTMAVDLARRTALTLDTLRLQGTRRERHEWFRGTLSSIGDAVIATDVVGAITFINPAAEALTGWPHAEALGQPIQRIFRIVDERTLQPTDDPTARALREGTVVGLANHTLLIRRDGSFVPIDDSGAPIHNADGRIVGAVLVFRDIAARRRNELMQQQLAAIVQSSDDAIFSKDLDGRVLSWNASAQRMYGYSGDEIIGHSIARIFPPERREELDNLLARLRRGEHIDHYETERLRKDGSRLHIALTVSPIRDIEGMVMGASVIARDITERKLAEQSLRASRDQLAIILRGVTDGITAQDTQGQLIYANDAAAQITGYPSAQALLDAPLSEIVGKFEILDIDGRPLPIVELPGRLAMQGLQPPSRTLRFRLRATNEERWAVVSATPVFDEHGATQFVINIFQDITERWHAEQRHFQLASAVEQQRQRLNELVSAVPGVVWEAWGTPDAASQRIDFVSGYVETMLGYSVAEWLSIPNFWLSIVHPDDKQRAALEAATIYAGGQGGTSEFRWLTKGGGVLWVEAQSAVVCDEAGRPIGMRGITIDISERKRVEDEQRFLAQASQTLASSLDFEVTLDQIANLAVPALADWCAVHIVDEDGLIRRLAVAHVDPAKAARARARPERYAPDRNARYIVSQVVRSGRSELYPEVTEEVLVASARDAEHLELLRWLGFRSYICVPLLMQNRTLGTITLVTADSGRRYGARDLAMAERLAQRAATAIENAQLHRKAQEAIRVREVFLSVASHELKTPLTTLLGNAQLFQRRADREHSLGERDRRSLALIVEQSRRLNRMIEALLDLSRLETGQLSIERVPLDLVALMRRVCDEVVPGLDEHTLSFSAPPEPLPIQGDELRLEQVLQNLIQNALKYSPRGGEIGVRIARRDEYACIDISDQGIGIPQAALPRLFTRFYRASNVNPQHISGMGVGLYVVKEIVALHGGKVGVTSQEGVGSTFTICLPLSTS